MSPSLEQIRQTLAGIAADALDREAPLPDGDLAEHLDSMDRLALVVAIEDHYEIAFEPEDEEEVRTLEDVIRTVHDKLTERAAHA